MKNGLIPNRNDVFFPLEQHFNKFFNEFFQKESFNTIGKNSGFPKINAYEKDDELVLNISASGMTADDLKVEVSPENVLSIKGRISEQYHSKDNCKVFLSELRTSAFERYLQLPENIEGDPKACLKDGILTLRWNLKNKKDIKSKNKLIFIDSG
jgi:HSP20 family protein